MAEPAETTADTAAETTETTVEAKGNHEAARYRRRLREAEAERDRLQSLLTAARRQVALNSRALDPVDETARGDALGEDVDRFFTDDGTLDETALQEHVSEATAARPYLLHRAPLPVVSTAAETPDQSAHLADKLESALFRQQ